RDHYRYRKCPERGPSRLAALVLLTTGSLVAQPVGAKQNDVQPEFEIASIKSCTEKTRADARFSPTTMSLKCVSLEQLVTSAWVVCSPGLGGGGSPTVRARRPVKSSQPWIRDQRFTITAKANMPAKEEAMQGLMLQRLLVDRFRVKVREEQQSIPVYRLERAG